MGDGNVEQLLYLVEFFGGFQIPKPTFGDDKKCDDLSLRYLTFFETYQKMNDSKNEEDASRYKNITLSRSLFRCVLK